MGTPRPGQPPPSRLSIPHTPAQRSGGGTQAKACPLPGPLPATRSVYAFPAWRVRVGNGPGKPELAVGMGRGSRAQKPPPAASQHPGAVVGRKRGVHRVPLPPSAPFPRQKHPFLHHATHGTPGQGIRVGCLISRPCWQTAFQAVPMLLRKRTSPGRCVSCLRRRGASFASTWSGTCEGSWC